MGGMGTSTSEQKQQSQTNNQFSSQTNPWANSLPAVNSLLAGINGQTGNVNPNANETAAFDTLRNNAANVPNYAPAATNLAGSLLNGGGINGLLGGVTDNLNGYKSASTDALNGYTGAQTQGANNYQGQLAPYLSSNYLDPTKAPGIQSALETVRNDVANNVNGMFAGAGRDMSGTNQQSLARGIGQAEAPLLLNQYNQNVNTQRGAQDASFGAGNQTSGNIFGAQQGTAGNLYNAGNTSTGLLSNLTQTSLGNQQQGLDLGMNAVPQAGNAGAMNQLQIEQMRRNLPLQNLGMLSALTLPMAGLGGSTSGTSSGTGNMSQQGSQTMSPVQQFAMLSQGLGSLFGGKKG